MYNKEIQTAYAETEVDATPPEDDSNQRPLQRERDIEAERLARERELEEESEPSVSSSEVLSA